MKILLVNPSAHGEPYRYQDNMYPFSLLFLSSYVRQHGYRATILDLSTSADGRDELERFLDGRAFDVVGFTGTTENRFLAWEWIALTRRMLPDAKIVVGGNHFTYTAEQTLEAIPDVDVVVRGEGEITLLELLRAWESGTGPGKVLGVSYRENGRIVHCPPRPFEKNIEPFLIREEALDDVVLPHGSYSPFMLMRNYEQEEVRALPIHVGRGCPGKCVFCLYNKKLYRTRSVESVLAEIQEKQQRYDCRTFHLQDPHLLKRRRFIKEFCRRLAEARLDIQWYAETRVDIDVDLLERMRDAGCVSLDFGLESASEKVLRTLKKGITLDQARRVIERCASLGIRIKVFTMISLPDETPADARETLDFLKRYRHQITSYSGGITRIYPGSDLEAMAKQRGILPEGFNWYDRQYQNPLPDLVAPSVPLWVEHLSLAQIRRFRREVDHLQRSRRSVWRLVRSELAPFLFQWNRGALSDKCLKAKRLFQYAYAKLKYLVSWQT